MMFPQDHNDIFLNTQLYTPVSFEKDEIPGLFGLFSNPKQIDTYCVECGKDSTFHSAHVSLPSRSSYDLHVELWMSFHTMERTFECTRDGSHRIVFVFKVTDNHIIKIGQHPSSADLSQALIKKYHSILGNENFRELSKAVGLVSHGIGIGSFVYLRRIFDGLLEEAHIEAKGNDHWDEEQYIRMKVIERIGLLRDFLPPFLVENKSIYSVLSKGIHELSEEECLEMFPALQLGIELILDEKLEQRKRQSKIASATKNISSFVQRIKS